MSMLKFLIDTQLPPKLAKFLAEKGFDAIHTLKLPDKNRTDNEIINQISLREKRSVISKDVDFYDRDFRKLEPYKLIYLTTGNISNHELLNLFNKIWIKFWLKSSIIL